MKILGAVATILLIAREAQAHSHVTNVVIRGVSYQGFDPRTAENPDVLAAWRTEVPDDGWVGANDYEQPNIICHINATNANAHIPAEAGETISFQWNGWPESHHGPILTYLAYCGDGEGACETVDKTSLEFFEVDAVGLVDPNKTLHKYPTTEGVWASDLLIYNNSSFTVQLPPDIAPGQYVLRHEIIALHFARSPALGPQHYPQCFNFIIGGDGNERPQGEPGTKLYGASSDVEGLTYNIYQLPLSEYSMPGPTLFSGAVPSASQTPIIISEEGTAMAVETRVASKGTQQRRRQMAGYYATGTGDNVGSAALETPIVRIDG